MQRSEIKAGGFTLMVSLCGNYHVAPGGIYIADQNRAELVAKKYGEIYRSHGNA